MSATWLSVVVPCYNEEQAVAEEVRLLCGVLEGTEGWELLVVDDGSDDGTADELERARSEGAAVTVLTHAVNRGYGASLKTGIRRAKGEWILICDADGSYPKERIPDLLAEIDGADMVVGARTAADVVYPTARKIAKWPLKVALAWFLGRQVDDMNSGLRVFRRSFAERYWDFFPDGFSFTTTATLISLANGYVVSFLPISYRERVGRSKIRPVRDTLGFLQLIVRCGFYFAPLRFFLPVLMLLAAVTGVSMVWDVVIERNLTDKTVILTLFTLNTSLLALLADMIDKRSGR
jgi:glycosyltransferase involved in cell wall biosynthesis